MSMEYIRETYGVPARRGAKVEAWEKVGGEWQRRVSGRISSAIGQYLRIDRSGLYHPTYGIVYLSDDGDVLFDSRKLPD
jgi:hypothetical protein